MRKLSLILFLCLLTHICEAGTYYVSPSGSASWANCTNINTPCSPSTAMTNAVADDIVYFRGGTYTPTNCTTWEYVSFQPTNSGTAGHYITFIAYPGETPIISSCSNSMPAFGSRDSDYIIWDGFSSTLNTSGAESWLFLYWASTGSIVRNCNFTGNIVTTGNNSMIRLEQSSNNEIYNNLLHENTGAHTNTAAIWLFASNGAKIHNNNIYNNYRGIAQKLMPNINNEIYYNYFYNNSNTPVYLNESGNGSSGDKVYQNVFANNSYVAIYVEVNTGYIIPNYEIYNNSIYQTSGGGISTSNWSRTTSIWNNIISGGDNPFLRYYSGVALPSYSDYNDFYPSGAFLWNLDYTTDYTTIANWRTATGLDTNSITTDPNFINPGGSAVTDYKRTSYPTNGRGGAYASVMGAYITGNEIIGYTITVPCADCKSRNIKMFNGGFQ